jgi:hypothetical protein
MVFGANRQAPSQSTQYLVSDQASEPLQSLSSLHREKCQDDGCKTTSSVFISPRAYGSGNLLPSGRPTQESPTLWSRICYCMGLWRKKRYLSYNFCKIHVLISYKLAGSPSLLLTNKSVNVTLRLSSCSLLSCMSYSPVLISLVWSHLTPLLVMLWQNMPVSCYYHLHI